MPRYMVTHSLLASWDRAMYGDPYEDLTTERDPSHEFMQVLRREPTATTEAMQNGIDFENLVTDIVNGKQVVKEVPGEVNPVTGEVCWQKEYPRWYDAAAKVAGIVQGGQLQYKARKRLEVNGTDILLYGRLDVLKAGEIIDIKFSKTYDRGKYYHSTQHPAYFQLVPEAYKFTYLVTNGNDVWKEAYFREETRGIIGDIADFLKWLEYSGNMEIFKEKWVVK